MQEILLENGFVYYYANRIGYRKGDVVYVDPVFHTRHLKQRLKEDYGLYTKEQEGLYKRLLACMVYKEDGKAHVQFCRIWQWREEVPAEKKFLTYQAYTRLFGTVDINDYQVVYDGYSETDVLEAIFQKFHTNIPEGFPGHAIRMSDMIELYGEDGTHSFYYVDEFGFVEIEGRNLDETVERTPADCRLGQSGVWENNDSDEACHTVSEREETNSAGI